MHDDMVSVPGGVFCMGTSRDEAERLAAEYGWHPSWLAGESPLRRIDLDEFAIDRVPVTNRQYRRFVRETGHEAPASWGGESPHGQLLDHPVVTVNQADGRAYAAWAGLRLPTEAEWEKAARGGNGRLYPWGDSFDGAACCWRTTATTPVGEFSNGASPFGVLDLAGNVFEWCADGPSPHGWFLKGGSFMTRHPLNLRAASRTMCGLEDEGRWLFTGFRCARSVP
jgi:serine/threonine-protein kinase